MRKLISWIVQIIVLVLIVKLGMWVYQSDWSGGQNPQEPEVAEPDKVCTMMPDTEQCMCRNRRTSARISMPYEECVSRARAH
jgi:hypothetical protein